MGLNVLNLALHKRDDKSIASGFDHAVRTGDNTFSIFFIDGSKLDLTIPLPENGVSIENIVLNSDNTITCSMSDGTEKTTDPLVIETTNIAYTTSKDATIKNVKNALDKAMNINVSTLEYENAVDATINSVKGALDKLMTKTDSELETPLTPNVQMGTLKSSYPKGTPLEEIIRDMLTEKIAPKVTLSISPSKTLYDVVTEKISSLTINATVTKQTYDVAKIEYFINDVKVKENTSCASGGLFPYIHNTEINDTVVIKVVVTDTEGLKTTVTKKIEFVGRSYYGYIEPGVEITESVIKTLQNNVLQNTKALTYSGITCAYHKVVYCYDKAFGELSTIVDPINNFSYNNSFEKKTITVDSIEKLCYTLIEPTGADDVTIKFS